MVLPVDDEGGDLLVHEEQDGRQEGGDDGRYRSPAGKTIAWGEEEERSSAGTNYQLID